MSLLLQLEDYALTRLNIDWCPPTKKKGAVEGLRYDFDYDVGVHTEDEKRYKLDLVLRFNELGKEEKKVGYSIEANITGFFLFTPECDEPTREKLIRINGFSILYSTFRGLLGGVTGAFPGGKLNLPAVMPNEIVQKIEERRRAKAGVASDKAKATKP